MKTITVIAYLLLLLSINTGHACSTGFKPGHRYSLEQLVDQTNHIVLATFTEAANSNISFEVIETLKSTDSTSSEKALNQFTRLVRFSHRRFKDDHISNDFNGHISPRFWESEKELSQQVPARIKWLGGMCNPAFTFLASEQYLLLLDSPGSFYAAEIIKSEEDKWYQYVLKRLANSAEGAM